MLPGGRSTLRLSDPYHLQVSVTRSHAAQLMPNPTVRGCGAHGTHECECRTLKVACAITCSCPKSLSSSSRHTSPYAAQLQQVCPHRERRAPRPHQHLRHFISDAARARSADACASGGAQESLRSRSRSTRCDGRARAHKLATQGTKMMGYCAVTLDPCPAWHPWAACAISLQSRAFSWRASRLDQVRKNCVRTPCREGSRGSLFGHPA